MDIYEAAIEKKEREFNERASICALAARTRAAADAAARGNTLIARLVRQKARRNRVGLTWSLDKGEPRRSRKAVATDSCLLSRQGVAKRRSADMRILPGCAAPKLELEAYFYTTTIYRLEPLDYRCPFQS